MNQIKRLLLHFYLSVSYVWMRCFPSGDRRWRTPRPSWSWFTWRPKSWPRANVSWPNYRRCTRWSSLRDWLSMRCTAARSGATTFDPVNSTPSIWNSTLYDAKEAQLFVRLGTRLTQRRLGQESQTKQLSKEFQIKNGTIFLSSVHKWAIGCF